MVSKTNDKKLIIRISLALSALLLITASLKIYADVFADNVKPEANGKYVYMHTNYSFEQNFRLMEDQSLLRHPDALKRILKLTGYDVMIKPGRYQLTTEMNNLEIMRMLVSGRQEPFDIVFNYAERVSDLKSFWGNRLEADSNNIESWLYSKMVKDSTGLDSLHAILLFIPNTYNFYWNTSAEKLVVKMIHAFKQFWNEDRRKKLNELGLTIGEVGVMASIVQKETNKTDEMPVIAGVYVNRLNHGMPLQADPTIVYAMNDKSIRRVGGEMLQVESPFNTYKYKGLPPGPICIPNAKAIDAVLNYRHHKYIYFCAREDFSGYHAFAATFAQHQINARKYQRALDKLKIE
jgi:UPF0755 protein